MNEGVIDEGKFKDLVGKALNWFKNKLLGLWRWLSERIGKIVDAANNLINKGIYYALQTFELDVDVEVNTTVKL